ncbi:MAG: siderophore ferric iron reductase [Paraglaciecola sp.]|jgi:siderophore ferric iron reductase
MILLDRLLDLAVKTSPGLRGEPGYGSPQTIRPGQDNRVLIAAVYQDLQALYPDAGVAYFRARTWALLCWQPIYLALISIYGLKALPQGLTCLAQKRLPGLVCGFNLPAMEFIQDDRSRLIEQASRQIQVLTDELANQFIDVSHARKAILERLLTDTFLETFLHVYPLFETSDVVNIRHEAAQWISGFGFDARSSNRANNKTCSDNSRIVKAGATAFQVKRISCCMHYRRDDGELCANCPKLIELEARKPKVK